MLGFSIERLYNMMANHSMDYLLSILGELRKLPGETEWVEFKHNNANPDEIGEYISALSNSAALLGKVNAWLIWGVDNESHDVIGTTFEPIVVKAGHEELENWLLRLLKKSKWQAKHMTA